MIRTEGEKEVERLLRGMGFGFVASNFVLQDYPDPIAGEVDLVFECGDTLLLVEVGGGRHKISAKKKGFFERWKEGLDLEALRERLGIRPQRTVRAYFDLRPRPSNPGWPEVAGSAALGPMNRVFYREDLDRLAEGVAGVKYTKADFLADFPR